MPQLLHSHLRTGLDYDGTDLASDDLLENIADEHYNPEHRAAKRRRIEAIATSYLRGRKPLILSARLRGPFDRWENPWENKLVNGTVPSRTGNHARTGAQSAGGIRGYPRNVTGGRTTEKGVKNRRNGRPRANRDTEIKPAQETLPLRDGHGENTQQADENQGSAIAPTENLATEEHSGATEYFSVPAQRSPNNDSPWLTRLPPESAPVGTATTPHHPVDAQEWRSSASASMVISSQVKAPATAGSLNSAQCVQHKGSLPSSQTMENTTPAGHQQAATPLTRSDTRRPRMNIDSPAIVQLQEADPTIVEGYQSAARLARQAIEQASPQTEKRSAPILREEIQRSAALCVQQTPTPLTVELPKRRKILDEAAQPHPISHNLVASPGPASSTGFVYRRTEKTRPKEAAKPRPVTFTSSPGVAQDGHRALNKPQSDPAPLETNDKAAGQIPPGMQAHRLDVYDIMVDRAAVMEDHTRDEEHGNRRSSRLSSNYSTQTALMLAQREFQEGTFPSISFDTPRATCRPDETPQTNRRELSPVITPFHTFNVELDKRHPFPPESVLRGPPLSTQDLFTAASPFAFSTVKKKSTRSQRSSLRFAVLSNEGDEHADHENGARSPTPSAERIPLKDRNSKVSFRDSTVNGSEKGSQDSLLQYQMSRTSKRDVELPLLDFHTSLDDIGPNGDLEFTDRFLRNLDGIT
ncbi:hypothetical protein K505DRAFT_97696 [Melanomma pulvis-pyrius CBS 109.77]|uniref:Uncharacterized protein n=1 Tax=Melanomma pulvis-pyrius CBS 109.77 TaxID=1314802 RepID=A0A6A6XSE9_9PLEO|nr:hypothetical protein K505DRAFT_97696 [Melanomma pulvis-pyrius CBS 109.77]